MILSRKIELDPNNCQRTMLRQHCGVARHAWNWGLQCCIDANEQRNHERESGGKALTKFPTAIDLHKRLVSEVKPQCRWYYNSSKCAPQQALRNLESAFKRMHKVPGTGFPKFKKGNRERSFYTETPGVSMKTMSRKVCIPKIGWIRCNEPIPDGCSFKSVVISEKAGRWFMSFKMNVPDAEPTQKTDAIGVDLGLSVFATTSTGKVFVIPKQEKLQKKLVRLQRQLSRRKKGSGRRKRTQSQIAVIHYRISNARKDATHKLTSDLARNHGAIVIEDLNVSGMMRNHHLAASIAAANFGEVRRQLTYKTKRFGSRLVVVDRWFPSSQLCSCCGHRQKMPLSKRQYSCPRCGLSVNRNLNAARNLAASSAVNARENREVHALNGRCPDCSVKNSGSLSVSNL